MKFTDTFKPRGPVGLETESGKADRSGQIDPFEADAAAIDGRRREAENGPGYARPFSARDTASEDIGYYAGGPADKEFTTFQDRLRKGKVKLCSGCGGVMARSSRMILSPLAGASLVVLGALLMILYGLATNFYQPPWFITFALPAGYYVGSIFIGVGILFFFIREKVWNCPRCKEMRKR
ncbi:MAG: hypothetical protein HY913_18275 [Desulfomonile tiedjei]|nr:hypothetical protein [Desulfomonile tiedjei]